MSRLHFIAMIFLLVLAAAGGGCRKAETSEATSAAPERASNSNQAKPDATANANGGAARAEEKPSAKGPSVPSEPLKLIGKYSISEVKQQGVVNMISALKTEFSFRPDGTYYRVSKLDEKVYHSDAGRFRIEGNDQLVLMIQVARKKVYATPLEKRHTIELSPDGEELRMKSSDGKVAIFRRTSATP